MPQCTGAGRAGSRFDGDRAARRRRTGMHEMRCRQCQSEPGTNEYFTKTTSISACPVGFRLQTPSPLARVRPLQQGVSHLSQDDRKYHEHFNNHAHPTNRRVGGARIADRLLAQCLGYSTRYPIRYYIRIAVSTTQFVLILQSQLPSFSH